MSEESDITKKIRETKRQTEELKNQLQYLIDEGKNLICPSQSKQTVTNDDEIDSKPLESPNKVQIIKSYDNQHSNCNTGNIPPDKTETKPESPIKAKSYDVKQTRQYMKKQKERLIVKHKQSEEEKKIKVEIQKKKLQELNKKSRELLAKNVQAKRERSKSTDRNNYIRPDGACNLTSNLIKAKSLENLDNRAQTRLKNPNLLYPPEPHFLQKNSSNQEDDKNDPNRIKIIARNYPRQEGDNKSIQKKNKDPNLPKHDTQNTLRVHSKYNADENKAPKKSPEINVCLEKSLAIKRLKPKLLFKPHQEEQTDLFQSVRSGLQPLKNILEYKSSNSSKSNLTEKSPKIDKEKIEQENKAKIEFIDKKSPQKIDVVDKDILIQKTTGPLNKCSVEIQTERLNKEYPKWLDEQPPQAYPFNFINTIKRKLQVATMQKSTTDVGIQSSVIEPAKYKENHETVISTKSPDSKYVKKCDLKSFISRKCLNLDPKTIDHLELIPKKNYGQDTKVIFRNLHTQISTKISETESESDTSKNIPDISSESGTSLKKNAESVRKVLMFDENLAINTERIDNIKLIANVISTNTTSIRTKSKLHSIPTESKRSKSPRSGNTLSVENLYVADFDSDIDTSSESLEKSRQSVISFNKPSYNQKVVSNPEISKYDVTSQKSISSINTEARGNNSEMSKSLEVIQTNGSGSSLNNNHSSQNDKNKDEKSLDLEKSKSISNFSSKSVHINSTDLINKTNRTHSSRQIESSKSEDGKVTSSKNSSVGTETRPSTSIINNLSKSHLNMSLQNINTERGSFSCNEIEKSEIPPLTEPVVSLVKIFGTGDVQDSENSKKIVKNISIRSNRVSTKENKDDANQIHLKFEAEIHLLNDFNESLRKFSALEQVLETLKTKNNITTSKILQNNDAQTSLTSISKTSSKLTESVKNTQSQTSQINYSRGSFINTLEDSDLLSNSQLDLDNNYVVSAALDLTNLDSVENKLFVKTDDHLSNFENLHSANFAGISINMFEQLIKDEDARLENLKTILKIREQALLDRTKGELAWLEIQRKHFKETGKLHEASVIKKKQRGILVYHQKEKHEMQRLKQMQKAASLERKIVLKEQRNLIRQQLSTDNMLTKMKVNIPKERRLSGPLKVLQSHTESIRSETSISRKSSGGKEKDVLSITSRQSVTSHHSVISELSEIEFSSKDIPSLEQQKDIKRSLLMRETALKKRRQAAEELLQWHKKLIQEEKKIAILESTASAIISQNSNKSSPSQKLDFKGKQLNQIWFNFTGSEVKKFVDDKVYPMSQLALERFCKSAREYSRKSKSLLKKSDVSVSENIPTQKSASDKDYISDFDKESIATEDNDVVDQSIDILINNFNKIQDDISTLSIIQTKKSSNTADDILSESLTFDNTESAVEISVIETNRTNTKEPEKVSDESKSGVKDTLSTVPRIDEISENLPVVEENLLVPNKNSSVGDENEKIPEETTDHSKSKSADSKPLLEKISIHLTKKHSSDTSEYSDYVKSSSTSEKSRSKKYLSSSGSDKSSKKLKSNKISKDLTSSKGTGESGSEEVPILGQNISNKLTESNITPEENISVPSSDPFSLEVSIKSSKISTISSKKSNLDVSSKLESISNKSSKPKSLLEENISFPLNDLQSLEGSGKANLSSKISTLSSKKSNLDVSSKHKSVSNKSSKSKSFVKEHISVPLSDQQSLEGSSKIATVSPQKTNSEGSSKHSNISCSRSLKEDSVKTKTSVSSYRKSKSDISQEKYTSVSTSYKQSKSNKISSESKVSQNKGSIRDKIPLSDKITFENSPPSLDLESNSTLNLNKTSLSFSDLSRSKHKAIILSDVLLKPQGSLTNEESNDIGVLHVNEDIGGKSEKLDSSLGDNVSTKMPPYSSTYLKEEILAPLTDSDKLLLKSSSAIEKTNSKHSKSDVSLKISREKKSSMNKSYSNDISENVVKSKPHTETADSSLLDLNQNVSRTRKSQKMNYSDDTIPTVDQIHSRSKPIEKNIQNILEVSPDKSKKSETDNISEETTESTRDQKQVVIEEQETIDENIPTIASDASLLSDEENELNVIPIEEELLKASDNKESKHFIPITTETKESLNESQEIIHILGEPETKTSSDEEMPEKKIKDSLNASEEILTKLNGLTEEDHFELNKINEDPSQSFLKLCQIGKSDKTGKLDSDILNISEKNIVQDISLLDDSKYQTDKCLLEDISIDLIETNVDETMEDNKSEVKSDNYDFIEEIKTEISTPFKIDKNNEDQTFLNSLVASASEINIPADINEESDESKLTLSDKSSESFVIKEINEDSNEKLQENLLVSEKPNDELEKETPDDYSSIMEEVEEESEANKSTSRLSYGVLQRSDEKYVSDSFETDVLPSKEDVNSFEEKEHDSMSSANGTSSSEALNLEEQSLGASEEKIVGDTSQNNSIEENISLKSKSRSSEEVSSTDVKKRISEILADTNISRGDKSPRLQDLYTTAYDIISPANSPEKGSTSPKEEHKLVSTIFDNEAEEILRKQLAVEEEIKAITEQQQKEQQMPLMYIREIPNKPPPPYTPPSSLVTVSVPTIIPTSEEIEEITMYSAKILHKAYLSNNLVNVNISNNTLSLISKDISKDCYKFVFDLCKDIAREHYNKFEEDNSPSWLRVSKKMELTLVKPFDTEGLKAHLISKLKEIFGYQKSYRRENAIIKWSRKKRDHVDEVLVKECLQEEAQWTNYQKDELLVKDQITNKILDSLLQDTALVFQKIFLKRS